MSGCCLETLGIALFCGRFGWLFPNFPDCWITVISIRCLLGNSVVLGFAVWYSCVIQNHWVCQWISGRVCSIFSLFDALGGWFKVRRILGNCLVYLFWVKWLLPLSFCLSLKYLRNCPPWIVVTNCSELFFFGRLSPAEKVESRSNLQFCWSFLQDCGWVFVGRQLRNWCHFVTIWPGVGYRVLFLPDLRSTAWLVRRAAVRKWLNISVIFCYF